MKFIHTADWHLGKLVHGISMLEDQIYVLNQFIHVIEDEKPDLVIIAGDLYDRSVPPTEAVKLLDETLFKINVEMNIPIIAITGNHDSAERLSFGSTWYRKSHLYIEGKVASSLEPIQIKGVNFYSVPYAEPGVVREALDDDSIHSHQDAMKAITGRIEKIMNPNEANVLVGHAFVLGGKTSDSERVLSVGGSGCVSADVFAPFDYTALGHLHSPDALRHSKVFYSGSLLKYSFSEAQHKKSISIVEMNEDGRFDLRYRTLSVKHDMRELTGYMDELLDPSFYQHQDAEDYLKITLLDEGALIDPIHHLRQVYPNVLHLERKWDLIDLRRKQSFVSVKDQRKSELELFETFYHEMTDREFDQNKQEAIVSVIESVKREEDSK